MTPATKISILLIVTLSLLCSMEGLICNVCEKSMNSKCNKGQDRCFAYPGQSCSTISHYSGSKHLYSKHLCQNNCKENEYNNPPRMIYVMCCDKDLCNIF